MDSNTIRETSGALVQVPIAHVTCSAGSLLPSGVGGFKVCIGLFDTCLTMGEKIRILSLPRDWVAGGRYFFFFYSMLYRQRAG